MTDYEMLLNGAITRAREKYDGEERFSSTMAWIALYDSFEEDFNKWNAWNRMDVRQRHRIIDSIISDAERDDE